VGCRVEKGEGSSLVTLTLPKEAEPRQCEVAGDMAGCRG